MSKEIPINSIGLWKFKPEATSAIKHWVESAAGTIVLDQSFVMVFRQKYFYQRSTDYFYSQISEQFGWGSIAGHPNL